MHGAFIHLEYLDQNSTSQRSDILIDVAEYISLSCVPSEQQFNSQSDGRFNLATHFQVGKRLKTGILWSMS